VFLIIFKDITTQHKEKEDLNMKRILLVLGIIVQMAIGNAGQAEAVAFGDSTIHWDGYLSATASFNTTDSINFPQYTGGEATIIGGALTRIDFFDNPAAHSQYAYDKWLGAGDLFIDVGADKTWDYVVRSFQQRYAQNQVGLYNISALGITTDPSDTGNYIKGNVRDNQPIALSSLDGATRLGEVTYSGYYNGNPVSNDYSVYFDFGQFAIDLQGQGLIVGYSPTCGNDVVLEKVPVPEPGTMALLGVGMLGLVLFGKRKMNKSA
jgi:hypothetical protein